MDTRETWTVAWDHRFPQFATIQDLMDKGIGAGLLPEMIVVIPDADQTCHYTDSPVKGGWGSFIARDLVDYVDRNYRTIASPSARALLGHSMGGHGAIKLAMTHPGIFGSVFALNPSLLGLGGDVSVANSEIAAASRLRSAAEVRGASFYAQAVVGIGQCFSPDPHAPLLTKLPFAARADGGAVAVDTVLEDWKRQMPLYMAASHAEELKALRGLRFDSAFDDEFAHIPLTTRAFAQVLDSLGVPYTFEMYNGDHRHRLWGEEGRLYAQALPWLGRRVRATEHPVASASSARKVPLEAQRRLWRAAQTGDIPAAKSALSAGADVNATDFSLSRTGRRALNYAAENNLRAMIQLLISAGADVRATNSAGFTALHHAAEQGAADATKALLAAGANPLASLPSGSTPLQIARQRRKLEVVKILEAATPRSP